MSDTKIDIKTADLQAAYDGSWYFIAGAGGDLQEWVTGIEGVLAEQKIGKPTGWFQTTGAEVNVFAGEGVRENDKFLPDLVCLLFPLDGLKVGALAMVKIRMQDRWFDDVIDNMRPYAEAEDL
jgi:hypothetical protein